LGGEDERCEPQVGENPSCRCHKAFVGPNNGKEQCRQINQGIDGGL
jgi:hypothetical protein